MWAWNVWSPPEFLLHLEMSLVTKPNQNVPDLNWETIQVFDLTRIMKERVFPNTQWITNNGKYFLRKQSYG